MKIVREYHYKDVEMLLGGKTVVENLNAHLAELVVERTNWTEQFSTTLSDKIDSAIRDFLGLDPKKDLRAATRIAHELQTPAMKDVAFFKAQIESDFKKDKSTHDEILATLGYNENLREVQVKDQEALIQLLYIFKKNMSPELKATITSKGMSETLINRIIGYADDLKIAGVTQETAKGSTKALTESAIKEFNAIYDEITSICKIAAKFYSDNKVVKDKFTFSKIIDHMKGVKHDNNVNDSQTPNEPIVPTT